MRFLPRSPEWTRVRSPSSNAVSTGSRSSRTTGEPATCSPPMGDFYVRETNLSMSFSASLWCVVFREEASSHRPSVRTAMVVFTLAFRRFRRRAGRRSDHPPCRTPLACTAGERANPMPPKGLGRRRNRRNRRRCGRIGRRRRVVVAGRRWPVQRVVPGWQRRPALGGPC